MRIHLKTPYIIFFIFQKLFLNVEKQISEKTDRLAKNIWLISQRYDQWLIFETKKNGKEAKMCIHRKIKSKTKSSAWYIYIYTYLQRWGQPPTIENDSRNICRNVVHSDEIKNLQSNWFSTKLILFQLYNYIFIYLLISSRRLWFDLKRLTTLLISLIKFTYFYFKKLVLFIYFVNHTLNPS